MKKTIRLLFSLLFSLFVAANLLAADPSSLPNREVMSQAYWDLWNDEVQAKIDERIEQYRKADATVFLIDVKPGSEVRIEQISHEFKFGANMFNFGQLGSKELDDKYKAVYHTLFNTAAIPFYWKKFEREPGELHYKTTPDDSPEFWGEIYSEGRDPFQEWYWRRPATDQMVDYCEKNGVYMHGHPMIWGNTRWHHPEWTPMSEENVAEIEKQFEKRIRELAVHYGDRINRWDIVNESAVDYLNPHHPKYDVKNPKGSYGILPRDYTFKAFQVAQQVLSKNVVMEINDYQNGQLYVDQVGDLLVRGCRIDMVGLQMHLFKPQQCADIAKGAQIQTPKQVYDMLKTVEKTGLPLHLSEITITAPNDDEEGRQIQANIARNLYRQWFSWPTMQAITWWNIVDGCGAPGEPATSGLFTRKMEPKASFYALDRLINDEWKTKIVEKAEEKNYRRSFRGFKGTYKISWTDNEGKVRTGEISVK